MLIDFVLTKFDCAMECVSTTVERQTVKDPQDQFLLSDFFSLDLLTICTLRTTANTTIVKNWFCIK